MDGILTIIFCFLTKYTVLGFESYRDELARLWINSCLKAGLRSPSMEHGLDIRDGSHAEGIHQ